MSVSSSIFFITVTIVMDLLLNNMTKWENLVHAVFASSSLFSYAEAKRDDRVTHS